MTSSTHQIRKILVVTLTATAIGATAAGAGARTRNPVTVSHGATTLKADDQAEARAALRFDQVGGNLSQAERRTSEFEH